MKDVPELYFGHLDLSENDGPYLTVDTFPFIKIYKSKDKLETSGLKLEVEEDSEVTYEQLLEFVKENSIHYKEFKDPSLKEKRIQEEIEKKAKLEKLAE